MRSQVVLEHYTEFGTKGHSGRWQINKIIDARQFTYEDIIDAVSSAIGKKHNKFRICEGKEVITTITKGDDNNIVATMPLSFLREVIRSHKND